MALHLWQTRRGSRYVISDGWPAIHDDDDDDDYYYFKPSLLVMETNAFLDLDLI